MKDRGFGLVLGALLAVSLAGCGGETGEDIDVREGTGWKSEVEKLLEGLGINTDWTPQKDALGKALPDGWNPLGLTGRAGSRKAIDPKYEIFRVFIDSEAFNAVFADTGADAAFVEQEARDVGIPGTIGPDDVDESGETNKWLGSFTLLFAENAAAILSQTLGSSVIYHNFDSAWPESDDDLVEIKRDSSENAWLKVPKKAIAADFDGDGYDDVLIAAAYFEAGQIGIRLGKKSNSIGFSSEVLRIDYGDGLSTALPYHNGAKLPSSYETAFNELFVQNEFQYYCFDLATGDIDHDGKMEALLVVGNAIYLLDSGDDGATWTAENFRSLDLPEYSATSVAFADYNNDGYDDWVEASATIHDGTKNATFTIYNGKTREALGTLNSFGDIAPAGTTYMLSSVNVVTGDFDGDGLPETAFCGREFKTHDYMLYILDTWIDETGYPQFGFWDAVNVDESRFPFPPGTISYKGTDTPGPESPAIGSEIPALVAGDFNGDGVDEIFVTGEIFGLDADGAFGSLWKQDTGNNTYYDLAACGDINADGLPDIVYLDWRSRLVCVNFRSGSYNRVNLTRFNFMLPPYLGLNYYPALALANINDDSYIVEYEGQQMDFTPPIPVAVIASPPYYDGENVPQNRDDFSTTYGAITVEQKITAGLDIGLRLEGEEDAEIDGSCLLAVFGTSNITKAAIEYSTSASIISPFGENTVVFTGVPYYVYKYKILNASTGNKDANGKKVPDGGILTFSYPGQMGIYTHSMDFYNSHNGANPAAKIPSVIGQPFTYPTRAGVETIATDNPGKVFLDSNAVFTSRNDNSSHVGEANVPIGWTLDSVVSTTDEYGFSVSHIVKTQIPDGFRINTRVPDLPSSSGLTPFNWSLTMYPLSLAAASTSAAITFNYMSYTVDAGE